MASMGLHGAAAREAARQAMAIARDRGGVPFELLPAQDGQPAMVLNVKPATVGAYFRFYVRRRPDVESELVETLRAGIEVDKAQRKAEADKAAGKPATSAPRRSQRVIEAEIDAMATEAVIERVRKQVRTGPETMAALAAIVAGNGGDEEYEEFLMGCDRLPDLYELGMRVTHEQPGFQPALSAMMFGPGAEKQTSPEEKPLPGPEAAT